MATMIRRSLPARARWAWKFFEQVPNVDAVIVPVGGAGLIAGVSLAVKTKRPKVKIIAVEAENGASFSAALKAGKPTRIEMQPTLADGLAIPQVGKNAFEIAKSRVDRAVTRQRGTNRAFYFAHRRVAKGRS